MAAPVSFWTRVGSFLRNPATAFSNGDSHAGDISIADGPPRQGALQRLMRSPARDAYERMGELMTSIQRHFDTQDMRAEQLGNSVARVATTLEQLAETQRTQESSIRAVAEQVEASSRLATSISDSLARMPATLAAQSDALRSIARQMEILQESDSQLVISLQKFSTAADALNASGVAQVEMLKRLHDADQRRHDQTAALIRDQGRRMLIISIACGGIALAAFGCVIAMLVTGLR